MKIVSIIIAGGLLGGPASHLCAASAEENHLVGDLLLIPSAQWQKDADISVSESEPGAPLTLESRRQDSGSVRPHGRYPLTSATTLDLQVENVRGDLTVQLEWFDAKGAFLKATPLTSVRGEPVKIEGAKLSGKAPGDIQPAQFGLKFWLGESARCEISRGIITGPIRFMAKGAHLLQRDNAGAAVTADPGLLLETLENCWKAQLEPDTSAAAFVLTDKADYKPDGVVLANILSLNMGASVSVHVLCWNAAGTFLKEVNVLESLTEAGEYESGFALFKDQFPPDTDTVSFKIWIGGVQPKAYIEGIYYGAP